jgi:hypothetical protein
MSDTPETNQEISIPFRCIVPAPPMLPYGARAIDSRHFPYSPSVPLSCCLEPALTALDLPIS